MKFEFAEADDITLKVFSNGDGTGWSSVYFIGGSYNPVNYDIPEGSTRIVIYNEDGSPYTYRKGLIYCKIWSDKDYWDSKYKKIIWAFKVSNYQKRIDNLEVLFP